MNNKVASILAYGSFTIISKNIFVVYGDIELLEGREVKAGMELNITCSGSFSIREPIHSIEYLRKDKKEYIAICIEIKDPEFMQIAEALQIGDEVCEIYA